MGELRVRAREGRPSTCVYCRATVATPSVCERCDATYHPECRAELGRCATPGCVVGPDAIAAPQATPPRGTSGDEVAGFLALGAGILASSGVLVWSTEVGDAPLAVRGAFFFSFLVAPAPVYLAVRALYDARTRLAGAGMLAVLLVGLVAGWIEGPPWRALFYLTVASAVSIAVGVGLTLATSRRT